MDMEPHARFVVTAWRNRQELLQLRQDLYSTDKVGRQKAVNKVFAWRLRKPDGLPLLLDSTADIVDVLLQDERGGLQHNVLRLLYATAISRFVTGLADTQIELTRDRPCWFPSGKSLQLPLALLETRHRIVHRHLPSLAELKRAAAESLEWLWEWYWNHLDEAFKIGANATARGEDEEMGVESRMLIRDRLQAVLKTYVKERKNEVKSKSKESKAASTALSSYNLRFAPSTMTTQHLLLQLLVEEKMTLPTDKKLGSSMSGAFLIWSPFLLAACTNTPAEAAILPMSALITHMKQAMNAPPTSRAMVNPDLDPVREGLHDWILHILTSAEWTHARASAASITEDMLGRCLSEPTIWNLKLAEKLLRDADVPNLQSWRAVLDAARAEDDVAGATEVDVEGIDKAAPVGEEGALKADGTEEKISGPVRVLGMWKPKPIGWLPEGWEEDE